MNQHPTLKFRQDAPEIRGVFERHELDLTNKNFPLVLVSSNFNGLQNGSVVIKCEGATGTSGNVTLLQTNEKTGSTNFPYSPAKTLALGVNTANADIDVEFNMQYLALDFSGATLGSVGKIIVEITAKT